MLHFNELAIPFICSDGMSTKRNEELMLGLNSTRLRRVALIRLVKNWVELIRIWLNLHEPILNKSNQTNANSTQLDSFSALVENILMNEII
jgi:hypothetical protein